MNGHSLHSITSLGKRILISGQYLRKSSCDRRR
jgi:hypothetical protein